MVMMASTAVWFPKKVLDILGEIMNVEEAYLLVATKEENRNN